MQMKQLIMLAVFVITVYLFLFYLNNVSDIPVEHFTTNKQSSTFICYLFYTNKCPHSMRFLNDPWNTVSNKYSDKITFQKIDCYAPENKNFCKALNIREVPTIMVVRERLDSNNVFADKQIFKQERTFNNFEAFIVNQIKVHEKENFTNTDSTSSNSTSAMNIDNINFTQDEQIDKKTYEYCVSYMDINNQKPIRNCQEINEKNTNVKSWQGAYTVMSEFINKNASSKESKNVLADKIKNNISDWHLCDPVILDNVKKSIKNNNGDDMDTLNAIKTACGL